MTECKFKEKRGYRNWCNKLDEVCDVEESEHQLCVSFEEGSDST